MTDIARFKKMYTNCSEIQITVKLGDKERFDKEQIVLRNNFKVNKKLTSSLTPCLATRFASFRLSEKFVQIFINLTN